MKNLEKLKQLSLKEKARLVSGWKIWNTYPIKRLKIPSITLHDGPHGVRIEGKKNTVYPNLCLLACSFDRNLLRNIGCMLGSDCIENGVDVILAPGINLKRNVLGGRNFEYLSEDPLLTGELAVAYVKGIQSTGTSATIKHFCCNNQENYRMSASSEVAEDVLFNTYFRAFRKVIRKAHPDCIMTSYNRVNGERTNESVFLQKKVLRGVLGFQGLIMSDWGAVVDRSQSIAAGCDLEMPGGSETMANKVVRDIKAGRLEQRELDRAAENVLKLVDKHSENKKAHIWNKQKLLSDAVADSVVLLKNDGVLPIRVKKIGIYGDTASFPLIQGGGCAQVGLGEYRSPLDVLKERYEVVFVPTGGDISLLEGTETVLVFLRGKDYDSEGYDRETATIEEREKCALEKLHKQGKSIVGIFQHGGILDLKGLHCNAMLACYYGGEFFAEGLAKVLAGYSPSGRLAETFPLFVENSSAYLTACEKNKIFYSERNEIGYRYYYAKKLAVLYPFGFGLSYADIRYEEFCLNNRVLTERQEISGKITVTNHSDFEAKEVIQIYFRTKTRIRLVYFTKVKLAPRKTEKVNFLIGAEEFLAYDGKKYRIPDEEGELCLAKNSRDILFCREIRTVGTEQKKITQDMLVEDVVNILGAEVVQNFLSRPLGIALYSNENYQLPIENNAISGTAFEKNVCKMMPLKNLVAFSGGKFTQKDLNNVLAEFNRRLNGIGKSQKCIKRNI